MDIKYLLIHNLKFILLFILISNISNSTLKECRYSLKEVAYSYYMRGKNIQYNLGKKIFFSPEEATEQNLNFIDCASFVRNIYYELLNITLPYDAQTLVYTKENLGKPEVIVYSYINNKNEPVLLLYNPDEKNYKNITKNFSIKDIITSVQIGDILTYSGHTKLVYDIEKDNNGNVIDVFILDSIQGVGKSYINSKVARHQYTFEGRIKYPHLSILYLNNKLNYNFEEGRIEGSVRLSRLSSNANWANINNANKRRQEYSVLRIMQSDSNGNAVLKYKTIFPNSPNQFLYNDTLKLSKKNYDRIK